MTDRVLRGGLEVVREGAGADVGIAEGVLDEVKELEVGETAELEDRETVRPYMHRYPLANRPRREANARNRGRES